MYKPMYLLPKSRDFSDSRFFVLLSKLLSKNGTHWFFFLKADCLFNQWFVFPKLTQWNCIEGIPWYLAILVSIVSMIITCCILLFFIYIDSCECIIFVHHMAAVSFGHSKATRVEGSITRSGKIQSQYPVLFVYCLETSMTDCQKSLWSIIRWRESEMMCLHLQTLAPSLPTELPAPGLLYFQPSTWTHLPG